MRQGQEGVGPTQQNTGPPAITAITSSSHTGAAAAGPQVSFVKGGGGDLYSRALAHRAVAIAPPCAMRIHALPDMGDAC
jgi:hypothetical protein